MTKHDTEYDNACKGMVRSMQEMGYTKYKVTAAVAKEFGITYDQAYYRVKKHWIKSA